MASIEKVHHLLNQEVSRKEFLRYTGVALLSLVGVTGMLNSLRNLPGPGRPQPKRGYGMSAYGK